MTYPERLYDWLAPRSCEILAVENGDEMTYPTHIEALAGCPFCGKAPKCSTMPGNDEHPPAICFECPNGCSVSKDAPTYEEAVAIWNTRPADAPAGALREALRMLIEGTEELAVSQNHDMRLRAWDKIDVAHRKGRAALSSAERSER